MKKKTYILTLSKTFMKGHPKAGQPTNFKQKFLAGEKIHTIREGTYWRKVVAEVNAGSAILSIREWSDKPYASKQVEIAQLDKLAWQEIEIKGFNLLIDNVPSVNTYSELAANDGLNYQDFLSWFNFEKTDYKPFYGGIIHFTDFRY